MLDMDMNFGSDISKELDNMVKDDVLGVKANLQGLEDTKSTIKEQMQLMEKEIIKYESAIRTLEEKRTDHDRLTRNINGYENFMAKYSPPELLGDLEKKCEDLKSRMVTGREIDELMAGLQYILQYCKYKHTCFAQSLAIYDKVCLEQHYFLDALQSKLEMIAHHHDVRAKKAKRDADEPTVPSASVSARVERPSSPSY
jgi:prefoldin subunit 5